MYATFTNTEGKNIIDVKLQKPIEGCTQVGVVQLIYNPSEINPSLSVEESTAYLEYDLKLDKETILYKDVNNSNREMTPYTFFNNDVDDELYYSRHLFTKTSDIPKITVELSQDLPLKTYVETYNFDDIFTAAAVSKKNFYKAIYYKHFVDRPEMINVTYKRVELGIERFTIYVYSDVPFIRVIVNRAGYKFLNIESSTYLEQLILFKINEDKWTIRCKGNFTSLTFSLNHDFFDVLEVKKFIAKRYFNVSWPQFYLADDFVFKSKLIKYNNVQDFASDFNDVAIEMTLKIKTAISKLQNPSLVFFNRKLNFEHVVSRAWRIVMSDKLYNKIHLNKKALYDNAKHHMKSHILESMCVKSDTLIFDDQSGVYNELVILPVHEKGWFRPKTIKYVPLSINYVTHVRLYLTDSDNNPLILNDSQFVIVLHFIK